MKKWKPWVLTLATLTVASAAVSAVAITCSTIAQNKQINVKTKQINNLPMPKATTNDQIKQDWASYTAKRGHGEEFEIFAQHRFNQEIYTSSTKIAEAVSNTVNRTKSAKKYNNNNNITTNDSEKITTFSYGTQGDLDATYKDVKDKMGNIVENAARSVRAKSRSTAPSEKNFTPLLEVDTSISGNKKRTFFIVPDRNGSQLIPSINRQEPSTSIEASVPHSQLYTRNLGSDGTLKGDLELRNLEHTSSWFLWGTWSENNISGFSSITNQSQTPDYPTEDNNSFNTLLTNLQNKVSTYLDSKKNDQSKTKNYSSDNGDLKYQSFVVGLPADLEATLSNQKNQFKQYSTILLFDATNGGNDKYLEHKQLRNDGNGKQTGQSRGYLASVFFASGHRFSGYDQFLKKDNTGRYDSTSVKMYGSKATEVPIEFFDINLAEYISVQELTKEKTNGDVNTNSAAPSVKFGWNLTKLNQLRTSSTFATYFAILADFIQNQKNTKNIDTTTLNSYYALATDIYNENIDIEVAYEKLNNLTTNPNQVFMYHSNFNHSKTDDFVQIDETTNLNDLVKAAGDKSIGYEKVLPQFFSNDIYATIVSDSGNARAAQTQNNVKIYDGQTREWQTIQFDQNGANQGSTFNNYVSTTIKDLKMYEGNQASGTILADNNTRGLSGVNVHNTWTTKDTQSNFKYNQNDYNTSVDGNGIKFTWKWNKDLDGKLFDNQDFINNGIKLDNTPSSVFDLTKSSTSYVDKNTLANKTKTAIGIDKIGKNIIQNDSFNADIHQSGDLNESLTKSKKYYEKLQQAPSDLTQRTQDYYNAKKELDTQKNIHFNVKTEAPLQYWFKEQTYQQAINNKKIIKKENNNDGKENFIVYKFDHDYLKLNDLENYMEVEQVGADWKVTFKLNDMKAAIGNWEALTTKDKVFDNNGLHEYFNETFDTFWNKVIEIIKDKTKLNSLDLTSEDFKKDKAYTKSNNLYIHSKSTQKIEDIINDYEHNNYGQGGATNKKGWETPTATSINSLVYKFNAGTPKYQDGTQVFANRINNAQVTQQDQLTEAQKAEGEYNTKNAELESVKTEQEKITKQVQEAENNLKTHLQTIKKAESDWNKYIDSVIGTKGNNKPGVAESKFKTKYNEIIANADNQIEQIKKDNIKTWNETMDKYNLETQTYRPFNWMWLVAQVEITKAEADKYNSEIGNKVKQVESEATQALTNLLALQDQDIKQEFQTKRDSLYSTLKSTLDTYKNTLTNLQTEITEQKTKNTEVKTWMNNNKQHQDTIKATIDVKVNENGVQLYKPTNINEDTSWISKSDRWWSMYNPNGQQDPNNTNNQTRYLVDKDALIKNINKKIINDIKTNDQDFNVDENSSIITAQLIEMMTAIGDTGDTITGETVTIGENSHKYEITPSLTYVLTNAANGQDHKIDQMTFKITAVNQFIKTTNEKINSLKTQIDNNETSLTNASTNVTNLQTGTNEYATTKLEALITNMTKTTIESDVAKKGVTYSWSHDFVPTQLKAMSFYYKKLNPLFLIVMFIILIVLLVLLILLLVWLKKSNYRYRYTV